MTGRRFLGGLLLGLPVALACGGLAAQPPGPEKGVPPLTPPGEAANAGAWSDRVNGLKARLVVACRGEERNGTHLLDAYVELHNASGFAEPIVVRWQAAALEWTATDADGGKLRMAGGGAGNETTSSREPPPLVLPVHATLRLCVTRTWNGVGPNRAAHLDVGPCWEFERGDPRRFFLAGSVSIPPTRKGEWHGTLVLPKSEIPVAGPR